MKKLALLALTFLNYGAVYALPVGNPSEPSLFVNGVWWETSTCLPCDPCFTWIDSWNIRIGFTGDYVYNRHMEVENGEIGRDIQTTQINSNMGYLVLNFCERVDIFGRLGASKIHIRTNAVSWGSPVSLESELGFQTYLSWSAGARVVIWQCDCFALGAEGEYFQTVPNARYFLNYNDGSLTYFDDEADAFYSEWQVGVGISYRFATYCPTFAFVPYAAIKWSSSHLKLYDFAFDSFVLRDLESKKLWGYALGLSFTMCDTMGVTVEGRWADEKAFYVNSQARF